MPEDVLIRLRERLASTSRGGERGPKLTDEQRAEMLRRYADGERVAVLARDYSVSKQTVDYHVRRAARLAP